MGEHPDTSGDLIEIRDSKDFYGASCLGCVGLAVYFSEPWMALFLGSYSVWSFLRAVSGRVRLRVTEDGIDLIAEDAMTDFGLHRNVRKIENVDELKGILASVK